MAEQKPKPTRDQFEDYLRKLADSRIGYRRKIVLLQQYLNYLKRP